MLSSLFAVAMGGALGAVSRFAMIMLAQNTLGARFPYGTLLVNSTGSFIAGFFMVFVMERAFGSEMLRLFIMVGFLGAYTTYSAFSLETWMMYHEGESVKACLNILLNNLTALSLVFLGIFVARWLRSF